VRLFIALGSCWQHDSMSGRYLGIPRTDMESTINMWNIRRSHKRKVLESLVMMEGAALEVMNRGK